MSVQTVARRYASALADVVLKNGQAREVQEELLAWEKFFRRVRRLRKSLAIPPLLSIRSGPCSTNSSNVRALFDHANFLKVLLQNQRLNDLREINQKLAEILDMRAGMVAATVTTARTVPENAQHVYMRSCCQ